MENKTVVPKEKKVVPKKKTKEKEKQKGYIMVIEKREVELKWE